MDRKEGKQALKKTLKAREKEGSKKSEEKGRPRRIRGGRKVAIFRTFKEKREGVGEERGAVTK